MLMRCSISFLLILVSAALQANSELSDSQWPSSRFEVHEQNAQWWQYGWLTVHTVAALADASEASRTHNKASKRAHSVSSVSAALGVADILFNPLYPLYSDRESNLSNKRETQFLVQRIKFRKSWKGHLGGWLAALTGGLVTAAGSGKSSDGANFFVMSGLVSELEIWSLPSQAVSDWEAYKKSHQKNHQKAEGTSVQAGKLSSDNIFRPVVYAIPHGIKLHWYF